MAHASVSNEVTLTEQALPNGADLSDGQFTITEQLGAGGFGITYRAQDNVLGRTIVIKECFPEDFCIRDGKRVSASSKTYAAPVRSIISMFMHEARSLAQLRHANIVGVHGVFEENETAYMVLDLIDGPDLLETLESKTVEYSPARIREILHQLLDAIEKVHELDLLHRDISPDNIIIEKSGAPVLIDFGAARTEASRRTRAVSSMLVVKDGYSPPEFYVAGSEQTPGSDLYALGATFYHVLTGEAPPDSQARMIEISGRRSDPCKPLAGRIEGYDQTFLETLDRAMQIHPSDRLQSAGEWRDLIAMAAPISDPEIDADAEISETVIDEELERSLSQLVEETNIEVKKSRLIPVEKAKAAPTPKKSSKPEWADEFNRESMVLARHLNGGTLKARLSGSEDSVVFGSHTKTGSTNVGTNPPLAVANWIDRALEKQNRMRVEREAEFERELQVARKKRNSAEAIAVEQASGEVIAPSKKRSFGLHSTTFVIAIFASVMLYFGTTALLQSL